MVNINIRNLLIIGGMSGNVKRVGSSEDHRVSFRLLAQHGEDIATLSQCCTEQVQFFGAMGSPFV
jgi:hypothetical protein